MSDPLTAPPSDFQGADALEAHSKIDMLARMKAAVAAYLDKSQAKYVEACGELPPSNEILATFKRLKTHPRMDEAWKELSAKNRQGEFEHPVTDRRFRDEDRMAALVEELDRRDRALKERLEKLSEVDRQKLQDKSGIGVWNPAEREYLIKSLSIIGGEAERIVEAAVSLAACAIGLVQNAPPLVLRSKGDHIDDRQAMIDEAQALLGAAYKIRDFLSADKATIYDASVFEALEITIIPELKRNLDAKNNLIYLELQQKSQKKFKDLHSPAVLLHKRVQRLFGAKAHLYSTIANILSVAFNEEDVEDADIRSMLMSAVKNAAKGM